MTTLSKELKPFLTKNTLVTTGAIIAHVKEQYGISYSVPRMTKWLHRNRFSYKKPVGVPHKLDADKQQAFIEKYTELKQTAGKNEPILFMDAVHPTPSTKLSYGWLPEGERKAVATTGSRTGMNLIGALSLSDIARTVVCEYPRMNSETVSRFFTQIRKAWPISQKIHLILDEAPYHKTPLVKEQASEMNIELHYLPPYSPNLNPIERLWKVMNGHARNNRYFATAKDFRGAINGFFKIPCQRSPGR